MPPLHSCNGPTGGACTKRTTVNCAPDKSKRRKDRLEVLGALLDDGNLDHGGLQRWEQLAFSSEDDAKA